MKRNRLFFILFTVIMTVSNAQWKKANTPSGGIILTLFAKGDSIFAGTDGGGVYLSTNDGTNWSLLNPGMTDVSINSIAAYGKNIYAATYEGIYLSTNNGASWSTANNGLTNETIRSIIVKGTDVFVGTYDGIFVSKDTASSWTAINKGLTSTNVWLLYNCGENIFAQTNDGGLFVSKNNGESWTSASIGGHYALAMYDKGGSIFVGANDGLFVSADNGLSWKAAGLEGYTIFALAVCDSIIFAGTKEDGVFMSNDDGVSWTAVSNGLSNKCIMSLVVSDTNVYAGTSGDGVFSFVKNDSSWTLKSDGISEISVSSFAVKESNIFASTNNGIFLSSDYGTSWTPINIGEGIYVPGPLVVSDNNLIAASNSVYVSSDDGKKWEKTNLESYVNSFAKCRTKVFASTEHALYQSVDNGVSWAVVNTGIRNARFYSLCASGDTIFAGGTEDNGFESIISTDGGENWTSAGSRFICSSAMFKSNIYISGSENAFKSSDNGASWTVVSNLLGFNSFVTNGTTIFVGTNDGVNVSEDSGENWISWNANLTNTNVTSIVINNADVIVGTRDKGIWKRSLSVMTRIEEINTTKCTNIFPNPTKDYIAVTLNENATVEIFTMQGQLLKKKQVSPTDNIISVNELTSGSYVVRIKNSTNVYSEILIVE